MIRWKKIIAFWLLLATLMVIVAGCSTVTLKTQPTPSANSSSPGQKNTIKQNGNSLTTQATNNKSSSAVNALPSMIHMFDEQNGYGLGWYADHAVIMVTSNGGTTWTDVTPRMPGIDPGAKTTGCFVDAQTGWVFNLQPEKSVTIYGTQNGGQSWSHLATVPVKYGDGNMSIAFSDARHGWFEETSAGNGQLSGELFATSDGGETWQRVAASYQHGSLPFGGGLMAQKDDTLWLSGGQRAAGSLGGPGFVWLYKSTNGGKTWSQVKLPLSAAHKKETTSIVLNPVFFGQNGLVTVHFQQGDSVLYASQDGGRTWTVRGTLPAVHSGNVVYDFINSQEGWMIDNGNGIDPSGKFLYVTHNGGRSWQKILTNINLENKFVTEINFVNTKVGWMTGWIYNHNPGVSPKSFTIKSANGGISWENL